MLLKEWPGRSIKSATFLHIGKLKGGGACWGRKREENKYPSPEYFKDAASTGASKGVVSL